MNNYLLVAGSIAIIWFCGTNAAKVPASPDFGVLTLEQKDERNKSIAHKCIAYYSVRHWNYILSNNYSDVVNVYSVRPPVHGLDSCRILLRKAFNTIRDYKTADPIGPTSFI